MVKTRKNKNFNLEYYRSKYFVAYHLDNPAIEKKVDDMLLDAFSEDMSRFYDALLDAIDSHDTGEKNQVNHKTLNKKELKPKNEKMYRRFLAKLNQAKGLDVNNIERRVIRF